MIGATDFMKTKTKKLKRGRAVGSSALVRRALSNLVMSVVKRQSSPCSSMTHEDSAIADLCAACPEWQPVDEESRRVIQEAKEHMEQYAIWVTPATANEPPECGNSDTTALKVDGQTSRRGAISPNI